MYCQMFSLFDNTIICIILSISMALSARQQQVTPIYFVKCAFSFIREGSTILLPYFITYYFVFLIHRDSLVKMMRYYELDSIKNCCAQNVKNLLFDRLIISCIIYYSFSFLFYCVYSVHCVWRAFNSVTIES